VLGESITCLGLVDLHILEHAVFLFYIFLLFSFFFFFFLLKISKRQKYFYLVVFFSFFFRMHLDSPLISYVPFMDLIPCILECS
jgi:hypothetical protein